MTNFLLNNKKTYQLNVFENIVKGKVGFSLTETSVIDLTMTLYNYLVNNNIDRVVIARDVGYWSHEFSKVIINRLASLGIRVTEDVNPLGKFQISWFIKQTKYKSIGLYLGSDCHLPHFLDISFFNTEGDPYTSKELLQLLKSSGKVKIIKQDEDIDSYVERVSIDYCSYLKDAKILPEEFPTSKTVNVDVMFGAGEFYIKDFFKLYKLHNNKIFNLASEPPRLENYKPRPTDTALKWYTTFQGVHPDQYFFGVDGDGDSIGLYDLEGNCEIGPSSVTLLLLKHLKEIQGKKSGLVILSKAISDRACKYAKKLGYKVKWSDNGVNDLVKFKDEAIFYADETGKYYFLEDKSCTPNPLLAIINLIQLKEQINKPFYKMVEGINKSIRTKLVSANIIVSNTWITRDEVKSRLLTNLPDLKKMKEGNILSLFYKDKSKVDIKEDKFEELIEIFIEARTEEKTYKLSDTIQALINDTV